MQVMEFAKGSASAVAVSLNPPSADAFARELRRVKGALLGWRAEHGERCELVMFTIISAPEHHPAIEALLERVYREEAELAPLLQSLSVQVSLFNRQGKSVKEYELGEPRTAEPLEVPEPAVAKPWWRFW
jgi:hypothetical protein